jgi:predicted metal-dependent hydrolase
MGAVLYGWLAASMDMAEQLDLLADDDHGAHEMELTVRESRRARRLILQLVPPHTLEIVVPRGTRPRAIEMFVRENRGWIDRARSELASRSRDREALPRRVELVAIDREVEVAYDFHDERSPRCHDDGTRIRVACPTNQPALARKLLRSWILREARIHLQPWLFRVAEVVGEEPKRVQMRLQRTRWGSCSAQRTVSLNAALLLLEPSLVRYLMVHELCHLRWLDHSRRYWRLVERFEPDFRALDRRLTEAWTGLPPWLFAGRYAA